MAQFRTNDRTSSLPFSPKMRVRSDEANGSERITSLAANTYTWNKPKYMV